MSGYDEISAHLDSQERPTTREWVDGLKTETANYAAQLKDLCNMPPDEAMEWISSASARVHEMIIQTVLVGDHLSQRVRIDMLIPTRDELRFQFEVSSRRLTLMKIEAEQLRGMVA